MDIQPINKIFELKTSQPNGLRSVIKFINKFVTKCAMILESNRFFIYALTETKDVWIKIIFSIDKFEKYSYTESKNIIWIDTNELLDVLNESYQADQNGIMIFHINSNDTNNLHIKYIYGEGKVTKQVHSTDTYTQTIKTVCHGRTISFELPVVHDLHQILQVPQTTFNTKITISTDTFRTICNDHTNNYFCIKNNGNEYLIHTDNPDTEIFEKYDNVYDLGIVSKFVDLDESSSTYDIYIKEDFPMCIKIRMGGGLANINALISPAIIGK